MSQILEISDCMNSKRIGDVVFVHGLGGDAIGTWHCQDKKFKDDLFWPSWLGEDLANVGIWTLQYEVETSAWKGKTMPLTDRATNILSLLESRDFGSCPIVFITHSLGGLLVKQMLRHAQDFGTGEWKDIVRKVRGIIFISTPHSGLNLANWINRLGKILQTPISSDELYANDPRLRNLNLWYQNNVKKLAISTQVYYEKQKTNGILVVNETSADPGINGVIPIPMDANHFSICKPDSKKDLLYSNSIKFIKKLLPPVDHQGNIFVEKEQNESIRIFGCHLPYASTGIKRKERNKALECIENILAWKKIHAITENLYSKFLEFEHQIIRCDEAFKENNSTNQQKYLYEADRYLNDLRQEIYHFEGCLIDLPTSVKDTELAILLAKLPTFYEGMKKCLGLSNDIEYFTITKEIVKRVRKLLLEALHIADLVLEDHLLETKEYHENI